MINLLFNTNMLTLTRNGNTLNQHIPFQVENMSVQEASYYAGSQPYFRFSAYTLTTNISYQLGDLLKDEQNIDPRTNALAVYRVISQPEYFADHVEMALDKVVGV